MIRYFFYAAVAFVVCVLSRTWCSVFEKDATQSPVSGILLFLLAIASLAALLSVFVFFFIGLFKVLSNFNCW